jgi:hypothetical protein
LPLALAPIWLSRRQKPGSRKKNPGNSPAVQIAGSQVQKAANLDPKVDNPAQRAVSPALWWLIPLRAALLGRPAAMAVPHL